MPGRALHEYVPLDVNTFVMDVRFAINKKAGLLGYFSPEQDRKGYAAAVQHKLSKIVIEAVIETTGEEARFRCGRDFDVTPVVPPGGARFRSGVYWRWVCLICRRKVVHLYVSKERPMIGCAKCLKLTKRKREIQARGLAKVARQMAGLRKTIERATR
jgi:hypothetical protein